MFLTASLVAVFLTGPVAAPPEREWPTVQFETGGTTSGELPDDVRSMLGITLDRKALDSFERVLGASPLQKKGDAGEYFEWRCQFADRGACSRSSLVTRSLATKNGLRIGLTRTEVKRRTGTATTAGAEWYDRACVGKRSMTEAERSVTGAGSEGAWDVTSRITVVETDGRAEGFRVVWVATY